MILGGWLTIYPFDRLEVRLWTMVMHEFQQRNRMSSGKPGAFPLQNFGVSNLAGSQRNTIGVSDGVENVMRKRVV